MMNFIRHSSSVLVCLALGSAWSRMAFAQAPAPAGGGGSSGGGPRVGVVAFYGQGSVKLTEGGTAELSANEKGAAARYFMGGGRYFFLEAGARISSLGIMQAVAGSDTPASIQMDSLAVTVGGGVRFDITSNISLRASGGMDLGRSGSLKIQGPELENGTFSLASHSRVGGMGEISYKLLGPVRVGAAYAHYTGSFVVAGASTILKYAYGGTALAGVMSVEL